MQDASARARDSGPDESIGKSHLARRVLCATDLTNRSAAAEERATALAEQIEAEVLFIHALPIAFSQRARRRKFARAHIQLLSRVDRAMDRAPHGARVSLRYGTPIQAITAAANDWKPDLIVLARPQPRPLDLILGTTAERIMRATERPVLIVDETLESEYQDPASDPGSANISSLLAWRDARL